jgi:hypothetical protein
MKRLSVMVLCVLVAAVAVGAEAKELSVASVLSDGDLYSGKAVVVRGDFLYSEPVRESFTIGQGDNTIEVFYRDLPGADKVFILSLPKNAKTSILVSGRLRQYANKARFYFIDATAVSHEGAVAVSSAAQATVSLFDILSDPGKYVNKPVTAKGEFQYSEPIRQSFTFGQNNKSMEVIVSDLSKIDRERILGQKKNSKVPVIVTGLLQKYANEDNRFFITAYTVTLGY